MKLLFDENLSPKLPRLVAATFPGSLHVRDLGLMGCADEEIWNYASANGFTIVSKDNGFLSARLAFWCPAEVCLALPWQLHA